MSILQLTTLTQDGCVKPPPQQPTVSEPDVKTMGEAVFMSEVKTTSSQQVEQRGMQTGTVAKPNSPKTRCPSTDLERFTAKV